MEDYNTATFPSKKYYNLELFEAKQRLKRVRTCVPSFSLSDLSSFPLCFFFSKACLYFVIDCLPVFVSFPFLPGFVFFSFSFSMSCVMRIYDLR